MKEPKFLKEIHENQIKAHEERVKAGITLKEFVLNIEKETEIKFQSWKINQVQGKLG